MLPVVIALIGVLSWAVFDPIRELAIRAKVDGTLDARKRFVGWLKKETLGRCVGLIFSESGCTNNVSSR